MPDPNTSDLNTTFVLVRRAKAGEQEALGELLQRYYPRVRRIVRLRLGRNLLGLLDASDILQDTFVAAIKAFDRFELRNEASVINWLSRIAERKILMASEYSSAQKRGQGKQVSIDNGHDGEIEASDDRRGVVTSVSAREEAAIVEECIAGLPEPYREIIVLRDYVKHRWEDVAKEHGRPSVSAARMMHAEAMVELNSRIRRRVRG